MALFFAVDGGMSQWSNWTECSPDCGEGQSFRFRLCNSPEPAYGGANCTGAFKEERNCNLPPCPGELAIHPSINLMLLN